MVELKGPAMRAAEWLVNVLTGYGALGVLFAVAFVTRGISRVDPAAKGSGAGFRLIVFPGTAALWPLVLLLWIDKSRRAT
jgi:hypothetical protein